MIKNTTHKTVITEKIFDLNKYLVPLFILTAETCHNPKYKPVYVSFKSYWEKVYLNGNSNRILHSIKLLKK
jgi:hypothetical protein